MKFDLNNQEIELLKRKNISFSREHDYSDDEALDLLEQVRDAEAGYSQDYGNVREKFFYKYGNLADKIQNLIPEERGFDDE